MRKNRKKGVKISIGLFIIFILMLLFGLVFFKTDFQKILWVTANTLFLYAVIIFYLFSTRSDFTFWKLNGYFGIGLCVWAVPVMLVIRELGEMIAYMAGAGLVVMGVSIAGFSYWAEKKGIDIE